MCQSGGHFFFAGDTVLFAGAGFLTVIGFFGTGFVIGLGAGLFCRVFFGGVAIRGVNFGVDETGFTAP